MTIKDIKTVIEDEKEYKVETYDGETYWYLNEKIHREKGPAYGDYGYNGYIEWIQNDKNHRLDGPSVVWANGLKAWYINNIRISKYKHAKVRTMLAFGLDKV
jgi:hypothetical protein